jgi:uncharacterized membrane protein
VLGTVVLSLLGQPAMPATEAGAAPETFAGVKQIVAQHCHVCHSAAPRFPGFAEAPKGVMFDTPAQIKRQAPQIMAQAVKTHTMPLGNVTEITDDERSALGSWIAGGSKLN